MKFKLEYFLYSEQKAEIVFLSPVTINIKISKEFRKIKTVTLLFPVRHC